MEGNGQLLPIISTKEVIHREVINSSIKSRSIDTMLSLPLPTIPARKLMKGD
jgi:hypothetical protein